MGAIEEELVILNSEIVNQLHLKVAAAGNVVLTGDDAVDLDVDGEAVPCKLS